MKARTYFAVNKSKAGEAYEAPVIEAWRVKPGDTIIITNGISFQTQAEEHGWQYNVGNAYAFKNEADFARLFKRVAYNPQRDLPNGAVVEPVARGERIYTQPWDDTPMGVESRAETDGFIVRLPENGNKARFMSRSAFNNTFRTAAANDSNPHEGVFQYIPQPGDKPIGFVVLHKAIKFDFIAGPYTAPAGYILFENADDEDGYTVSPADHFFQNVKVTRPARTPGGPMPGGPF